MKNLMVSVSGVRGIIGESLTPELIVKYISAFATYMNGKKVVIGTDSRVSHPFVKSIVNGVFVASGYEVIDCGIVPTPTVQYITEIENADCGLIITASHNPIEWNGLKFVNSNGLFLTPVQCKEMFALADTLASSYKSWDSIGKVVPYTSAAQKHIDAIFNLEYIHPEKVKEKRYKVALDTVNGAGGTIMKSLLEQLGCEVVGLNLEATGIFAHTPEPVPENLGDLCAFVVEQKADFGIAVDPDVDRCVLVNEHGEPLGEEYTLGIAVKFMLQKKLGAVVKNLSSSRLIDDLARYYNCPVHSAAVGEINVAEKMIAENAVIGGEGNGGVMLPDIHIGRDAPIAAALVLQALAEFGGRLSELKATLPQYEIVKLKAPLEGIDADKVISHFKTKYAHEQLNEIDGLKIDAKEWWIHLRKSNTEPIIRVIGEAPTKEETLNICQQFLDEIKSL